MGFYIYIPEAGRPFIREELGDEVSDDVFKDCLETECYKDIVQFGPRYKYAAVIDDEGKLNGRKTTVEISGHCLCGPVAIFKSTEPMGYLSQDDIDFILPRLKLLHGVERPDAQPHMDFQSFESDDALQDAIFRQRLQSDRLNATQWSEKR